MSDREEAGKRILIFGAGRAGRGFIAPLAQASGYQITFVEAQAAVVRQLNELNRYAVYVMGAPQEDREVSGFAAIHLDDRKALEAALQQRDLAATAVGGQNLVSLAQVIAPALMPRIRTAPTRPLDVLICENFRNAGTILREAFTGASNDPAYTAWTGSSLGLVETQILKTCTVPDAWHNAGPMDVQVENAWRLPCDADAFRNPIPTIKGLDPQHDFRYAAVRKLYTYNCTNAVIAYLGHLKGYEWLCEAANDPDIDAVVRGVVEETQPAYVAEFGFAPKDQMAFHEGALKKYRDKTLRDPIKRNARDTKRKLSPEDRLVGPATLVLKHGGKPHALAIGIAAALHYQDPDDPETGVVQRMLREQGSRPTLQALSGLQPTDPLVHFIERAIAQLTPFNRIGVPIIKT